MADDKLVEAMARAIQHASLDPPDDGEAAHIARAALAAIEAAGYVVMRAPSPAEMVAMTEEAERTGRAIGERAAREAIERGNVAAREIIDGWQPCR